MLAMTLDHIGVFLLPGQPILRILGRLAMPIYAYLIAEGCRHSRNRKKYLFRLFSLGFLCQVVYFVAMQSLYQCILISFSLSVCLILLSDWSQTQTGTLRWLPMTAAVLFCLFLCEGLPWLLPRTDFSIDYGFYGMMLPVLVYLSRNRREELLSMGLLLVLLSINSWNLQWWGLLSLPILSLYNGQRGKWHLGTFFYLYYPLHLAIIYGISFLFG